MIIGRILRLTSHSRIGASALRRVEDGTGHSTGLRPRNMAIFLSKCRGIGWASTRDIQDHLQGLYGIEVSPTLVSNVTNKIMPSIKEWHEPLREGGRKERK